ncbi:TolC family protein [bacterium]|nr:TolC family protein [bacterium]
MFWLAVSLPLPAQPLDRQQIEALALAQQPRLQAAQLEVQATQKLVDQAQMTPNPTLSLGTEVPALRVVSRVQLSLSQPIELGGKRQARTRLAEVLHQEADARQQETQRQLLLEVRQAYAELLAAERKYALEVQAAGTALHQWTLAKDRFKLGDIPKVEVMQLEADASRAQAAAQQSQTEREARRAGLAVWLGMPTEDVQVQGRLGSDAPLAPLPDLLAQAIQYRPDLQMQTLSLQRRQSETRLEQARGVSDLTLQTGLAYDRTYISPQNQSSGLTGIGQPVVSLAAGLSIPLPFHDDNSGNIAAAQLRVQGAEAEREAFLRQVRAQVESAYLAVVANQRTRRTLAQQTLPLTSQTLKILEDAYRVRARSLTEVLNSRRVYLEAARAELEAARQEELALIRLEAAIAGNLSR